MDTQETDPALYTVYEWRYNVSNGEKKVLFYYIAGWEAAIYRFNVTL